MTIYSGTFGKTNNLTWQYNTDTGILKIDGSGQMPDFASWNDASIPWRDYRASVSTLIIGHGVQNIGAYAFAYFEKLGNRYIGSGVTSIGTGAFENSYGGYFSHVYYFFSDSAPSLVKDCMTHSVTQFIKDAVNIYTKGGWGSESVFKTALGYESRFSSITYDSIPTSGECGTDSATWYYDVNSATLMIYGMGAMNDETSPFLWKAYRKDIRTISIGSGITYIGANAFSTCAPPTSSTTIAIRFGGSQPTFGKDSFSLSDGSNTYANVYTPNGWGSDAVFTSDVKGTKTFFTYIGQYEVIFDSHGGSISPPTQNLDGVQSITLPSAGTRSEYNFLGWYTASSGGTRVGGSGDSYTVTQSITLHAQWKLSPYVVTFNGNGGTPTTTSATVDRGSSVQLPNATRTGGYVLGGWYTASSGGSKVGDYGTTYTPSSNVTLYAQWIKTYVISFKFNGGSTADYSETHKVNTKITLPSGGSRQYFDFNGWYTQETGGVRVGGNGDEYTVISDITLHAQWKRQTCTIKFNGNGGTPSESSRTVEKNVAFTLPTVTRDYYTFNGWYTASSGGTKIGNAGASHTITSSTEIFAQWTPIEYTVSFKNNYAGKTTTLKGSVEKSITAPTPDSRQYYTFDGWANGETVLDAGQSYYPTSNIEFTDSWIGIKYTVTYTHYTGITTTASVQGGTSIKLPTGRTDWSNSQHYKEAGWYSGTTFIGNSGSSYTVTRAINLTMLWAPIEYTVAFVSSETSERVELVGSIEKTVTVPSPKIRDYYTFNGWKNGTTVLQSGNTYTPTSDIEFTATWTGIKYTITYIHSSGNTTTTDPIQGGTSITLPNAKTDWTDSQYYSERGWYTSANPTQYLKSGSSYTVTRNEVLTMSWVGNKYIVSFQSEGGTIPSPIEYTYSNGVEITLPNAIADYEHHTFSAWKTGDSVYSAGSKYRPKGDVVFTATWGLDRYTVTYKTNTSGVNVPSPITVDALSEITLGIPTREHYDPIGWYTSESGGTKVGDVGGKYTVRSNITLYPQWTPTKYTVSFSVPSGVGSVADMVGTVESYVALPNITGGVTDKTFQGWCEDSDGSGTIYKVGYAYYPQKGVTLYAIFSNNFIVRLYRNYSSSDTTIVQTFSVTQGKSVTLSNYPTPDYYYCTGWFDARSNGRLIGLQGATYTPTGSIDLYAHWQNCPVVTFDAKGGTVGSSQTIAIKTTGQSSFQIKAEDFPADPIRDYHVFEGWYTINGQRYDKDSIYTDSITLQAKWREVRISEIRLSVNGQTGEVFLPESGIISNAKATIVSSEPNFTPDTSRLVWSSSNDEYLSVIVGTDRTTAQIVPLDVSGNTTVVLTVSATYGTETVSGSINLTLTQQVFLTLINDYATSESERIITIPVDDVTHLPTTFPVNPTRKGYEFNAWLDTSTDALVSADTPIYYNKRARARWFKAYDQWDKDNLIIQLYNNEGTAIVKQFAMGSVQSISTAYRVAPTSIPTPMQTSESTFLIDTAVTMTIDVECVRNNPILKEGESFDDDGEDYNYWTNRKWIDELMSLVDRWQGQSDGVKVLFIPNDCEPYDLEEGEVAFGEYYSLLGSTSSEYTSGFLYKGRYYQGKNAYITSFSRSIDQTSPETTQVTLGFAVGGLKSRYVK